MQIARSSGYVIEKRENQLIFYNLGELRFLHLSWFTGVFAAICLIMLFFAIHLSIQSGIFDATLMITAGGLTTASGIAFIKSIFQYRRRKSSLPNDTHIAFIADLASQKLLNRKRQTICELKDISVQVKRALDTYLTGDDGPYYEKVVLKYGWWRSVSVYKSESRYDAESVAERLARALFE